tara:strand:- start:631 stop:1704 length:1074 start_codon:yes stop_codon:yes gene_type:complete
MAYNKIQNPVFFVDYIQYALATGLMDENNFSFNELLDANISDIYKLFALSPHLKNEIKFNNPVLFDESEYNDFLTIEIDHLDNLEIYNTFKNASLFILGHNFSSTGIKGLNLEIGDSKPNEINSWNNNILRHDGWSGLYTSGWDVENINNQIKIICEYLEFTDKDVNIGSISLCNAYKLPHSPSSSLNFSYEYSNNRQTTIGGKTLEYSNWNKPKNWGELPAWGLKNTKSNDTTYVYNSRYNPNHSRTGRRVWEINFKMIGDEDLFGTDYSYNTSTHFDDGDNLVTGWNKENSFYNQFLHKTLGGKLPFIFHPNSEELENENGIDGFAICQLDSNSTSFTKVANNVYDVELRVVEVW